MKKLNQGFTLLEVVIALTILSFISLFTVEAIQRAISTKVKVQKDIDKNSAVRDALRVMERDINMAFNYRDPSIALYNMTQKLRQQNAKTKPLPTKNPDGSPMTPQQIQMMQQQQAANANAAVDPEKYKPQVEKQYTQFIGEASTLTFTSLSNVRLMEESPISSQAQIAYFLKPCRTRSTQAQSSNCLWRRIANYIHEDITKDGQETVLLENVSKFSLRYLGPGRTDGEWVDNWMTNERGDDVTKNKFPWAVEITVEVKDSTPDSKDKPLRLTTVAALRNPNNPNPNDAKDPANASGNPTDPANGLQPINNGQPPNSQPFSPAK